MYGKLRRTDFLPIGETAVDEQLERGEESKSVSSSPENGPYEAGGIDSDTDEEEAGAGITIIDCGDVDYDRTTNVLEDLYD